MILNGSPHLDYFVEHFFSESNVCKMYSSSGANSGYFSTNGQTSHGYIEPFYPNDGIESSPNEALVPHVTSPSSPKAKNKKKSGKCSCCQWDLASRSGHSLLAILANFVTVVIAIVCLVVVVNGTSVLRD